MFVDYAKHLVFNNSKRASMNKKLFSEADIKEKFITPAIIKAGWDEHTQIIREYSITAGRIWVKGKMTARGKKLFCGLRTLYCGNSSCNYRSQRK